MKQRIRENHIYTIDYNQALEIFELRFLDTTTMEWEEFQNELLTQVELTTQYRPKSFFLDTKNFEFPITPDMQTWIDKEIFPKFAANGLQRYAYLMSEGLVAQLSIEQLMEEAGAENSFVTKYFANEKEAFEWLSQAV